jgi:phospholipase C
MAKGPYVAAFCAAFSSLVACSASAPAPGVPAAAAGRMVALATESGVGKIRHVVYVVQENRSFDDMFYGYPGADTVTTGRNSRGKKIVLQRISLKTVYDVDHSARAMFEACDGTEGLPGTHCRMNGFNRERIYFHGPHNGQYAFVPHAESKPYFDMAHEFVLADRMFASQLDESFVAHQYVVAAQAQSSVGLPALHWGCWGGPSDRVTTLTRRRTYGRTQRPCFDYDTLGDELDAAGRSWRFYTSEYTIPYEGFWSAYQAVRHIFYGPDWKNDVITPQSQFLTDVGAGKLANFTWITPRCADSDHPACGSGLGPSWVASIVNAIGESKFWDSTVIFVQWDDWGGFYDHVPPPYQDYDGLGFRVGLIVIAAYAKKDYVSHVRYETASVLRYAEDLFGLARLSAADARAASPAVDCLDFTQKPRAFVPIKAPEDAAFFLRQPPDPRIPDSQ